MLLMVQSHPQCRRPGLDPPLEEVVATHSSILVGKIPWTEEPGGLPSMGSQRVAHAWATKYTHIQRHLLADLLTLLFTNS